MAANKKEARLVYRRFVPNGTAPVFPLLVIASLLSGSIITRKSSASRTPSASVQAHISAKRHAQKGAAADNSSNDSVRAALLSLPLSFESGAKHNEFLTRGRGYELLLTPAETFFAFPRHHKHSRKQIVSLKLSGANRKAKGTGLNPLQGRSNYLIGNDPARWRTNVESFAKVRYEQVYPGIDLVYHGSRKQLEYDFELAPGADPRVIRLAFSREVRPRISIDGDLVLRTPAGELREQRPVAYQNIDDEHRAVAARYVLLSHRRVGFELGSYDQTKPLVIDPTLVYSTYLGGNGDDIASSIAVDQNNNIYVAGVTGSTNFPTANPAFPTNAGLSDIFVTRIDAAGANVVYSTYVGGSGIDRASGIAVDSGGNAYVVGRVDSTSTNFPTTPGVIASSYRGGDFDAVVFKLNVQGNALVYSTYLGAEENDSIEGVAVDSSGNAYLTGGTKSSGFPTTVNAFQGNRAGDTDAFLTKINPTASSLLYSTYLGGGGTDRGSGVAFDVNGNAYLAGYTASGDFPTVDAFQSSFGGSFDAFIAKFDTTQSGAASLVYCSYLGGTADDKAYGVTLDSAAANAYIVGHTSSSDFPVLNPAQPLSGGNFDAFIAKVSSAGAKVYATFLGGSADDRGTGIAVNTTNDVYVTGFTLSTNFPTVSPIQISNGGGADAFVAKLNSTGSTFLYSTYLGGSAHENTSGTITTTNPIALDSSSNAYITGYTSSTNFPTSLPLQSAKSGGQDAFVTKISDLVSNVQFSSEGYFVSEGDGQATITVTRVGDTSSSARVDFATSDGTASSLNDYAVASGSLSFAPGETSKSFSVLIIDDVYVEGDETINLSLSNAMATFPGNPSTATLTITDNDSSPPTANPLDDVQFFVRQHYVDFLNREADQGGLAYWMDQITQCGANAACVADQRINVSAAFFFSLEFQQTGSFVYGLYKGALGRQPGYAEFTADHNRVIGGTNLNNDKVALANDFVQRPEFLQHYPAVMTNENFVNALFDTAALFPFTAERQAEIDAMNNQGRTRAEVLRNVIDIQAFKDREFNPSFVLMQYFGYLRRDIDPGGYAFWLNILNTTGGNNYRGMVCAFLSSTEYQLRFSSVTPHSNAECTNVH
jgi:Calx-beta domain/Beta-propeller repeat/Domain of unknown function (DUF4214)